METKNALSKQAMTPLNPNEIANLCFNVIIPTIDEKHHSVLTEHRNAIRDILVIHKIDSLKLKYIGAQHFGEFLNQKLPTAEIHSAAVCLWKALKKAVNASYQTLDWKHIVNAVRHEMNNAIARAVDFASSELGELEQESAQKMISAIKQKTERTLTLSEAQYLRSLIERATSEITLTAIDQS